MANSNWKVEINMSLEGQAWSLNLTSSEESLIKMLLSAYGVFENKLKEIGSGKKSPRAPKGLFDDALVLLRCLVYRRLEEHKGEFVRIERVLG